MLLVAFFLAGLLCFGTIILIKIMFEYINNRIQEQQRELKAQKEKENRDSIQKRDDEIKDHKETMDKKEEEIKERDEKIEKLENELKESKETIEKQEEEIKEDKEKI